ncbi:unnamed protein product (macronuclear) [Paramecium tetraurelia]|uniref:NET domain-containing protein n=1 Tax=Paramecium tetraurelia TaxID=5888 RepID=A0EC63_PARTE|nr:uncharacterized protein GSPATT00025616001 [Paramecium tetraurelia]CAK92880.1 unnamed protein product [Paramecium tetraurelia]|eukprot:XP_001460277.1 hypothetical protein (macronuclear) [Paramecium tetraurelia strain d4-2]
MASPIDFNLNQMQVDFILDKMPKGFSLLQASLLKAREQRVVRNRSLISLQSKKVNKYDASFQSNKQEVVEDKSKRIQRQTSTSQKESRKPQMDDSNIKKGLHLLQMFKSHPAFTQIDAQGQINIDKIEAYFLQEGNLIDLKNEIKQTLQKLHQNASNQIQDLVAQLEIHFYNVFKPISNQSKPTPVQNKNTLNKTIPHKSKDAQSSKKQDQIIITFEEKRQLGQHIRDLPSEHLKGVWEIVQQTVQTREDEELEFDIDVLPPKIIRKLQEYVKNKLKTKKVKVDPSINQSSQRSLNHDSSFASESFE